MFPLNVFPDSNFGPGYRVLWKDRTQFSIVNYDRYSLSGNPILNLINPILNFGWGGCFGSRRTAVLESKLSGKIVENYGKYLQNFCDTCKYLHNLPPYLFFVFCTREIYSSIDTSIKYILYVQPCKHCQFGVTHGVTVLANKMAPNLPKTSAHQAFAMTAQKGHSSSKC